MEPVLSEMPRFDLNKRYELPVLTLANPNRDELCILATAHAPSIDLRFNNVSEMTFRLPYSEDEVLQSEYRLVVKNRLIRVSNLGWFIIVGTQEYDGADGRYKEVTCYSYEYSLNARHVNLLADNTDGEMTYKFWDLITPETSLLGLLFSGTGWEVEYVSAELMSKYRTFELPDDTIYSFLMGDVEEAYECFFLFDTENKKVHAFSTADFVQSTDVVLTYDNVLKNVNIEEQTDDIVTAMGVYGADDMDIRYVNPLGNSILYDFSYYTTPEWMSSELIEKVKAWTAAINAQIDSDSSESFGGYLGQESALYAELSALNNTAYPYTDIATEEDVYWSNALKTKVFTVDEILKGGLSQIKTLGVVAETVKSALVTLTDSESKAALNILNQNRAVIENAQSQKEALIKATEQKITALREAMNNLVQKFQMTNYFTADELEELYPFIYEGSYSNENYVITDSMSNADTLQMSKELLIQGRNALSKSAQPQYTFSCDVANFMLAADYADFADQICLGATIDIEAHRDEWVRPILLEMSLDYENPESLTLTFGNRFRISNATWEFGELYTEASKTSNKVNINAASWSKPVRSGLVDRVTEYMENSLNAANQEIINSQDQDVKIGEYGILCREKTADGYSKQQLAIIKNLICMTDDNWATSKLAIGNVDGKYCVNAEVLAGKLICGNELVITTADNSFNLDAQGATLTNATFNLVSKDGRSQISINPTDGIKIQTRPSVSSSWSNSLYIDGNGELTATGNITANKITATSGSIGGWGISSSGLSNGNNYIYSNGNVKLGALTIDGNSSTFSGNVYASNLQGQVSGGQIATGAVSTSNIASGAVDYSKISSIPSSVSVYSGGSYVNTLSGYVKKLVVDQLSVGDLSISGTLKGSVNLSGMGALQYYSGGSGIMLAPNSGVSLTLGRSNSGTTYIYGSSCRITTNTYMTGNVTITGKLTVNGKEIG